MSKYYDIVKNGGAIEIEGIRIFNKNGQFTAAARYRGEAKLTDHEVKSFIEAAIAANKYIRISA